MKKTYAQLATLAAFLTTSTHGISADIRPFISDSGSYRAIVIEGRIDRGDYDRFVKIIRENQAQISGVWIFSAGGDFDEAIKIGHAMRALDLASQVPMRSNTGRPECGSGGFGPKPNDPKNCNAASAAFFIHLGATHKGGTYLAVHRPVFTSEQFGNLSETQAQVAYDSLLTRARSYMTEMGTPPHIQEEVLNTPSDRALVLDEKTVRTHFWGQSAYRHEWVKNKCSRLSREEREQSEEFTRRLLQPQNKVDREFSSTELEIMRSLKTKEDAERQCAIDISRDNRTKAFEKFFGSSPSDTSSQNFTWWSQSHKYLGREFYEISAEERFTEERFGKNNFLKRTATATLPYLSLGDFGNKPRVVSWINVVSTPNPSTDFIRRLTRALEEAWGKPSGGNLTDEWRWNAQNFSAKLHYEKVSSTGPFISLVIENK